MIYPLFVLTWHTSGRNQNVNKKGVELWSLSSFPPGSSLPGFHLPFSSQSRAGDLRPGWLIINHLPIFCISSCQFLSLPFRFFCSSGLVLESLISGLSPWSVCPRARCMLPSPSSCRPCPPCCYDDALSGPTRWTFPRPWWPCCPGAPHLGWSHSYQTLLCRPPPWSHTPHTTEGM